MRCGRIDLFKASSDNTNRFIAAKSIVFDLPEVKLSNACLSELYILDACSSVMVDDSDLFFSVLIYLTFFRFVTYENLV